jgi:hypothetical protein
LWRPARGGFSWRMWWRDGMVVWWHHAMIVAAGVNTVHWKLQVMSILCMLSKLGKEVVVAAVAHVRTSRASVAVTTVWLHSTIF